MFTPLKALELAIEEVKLLGKDPFAKDFDVKHFINSTRTAYVELQAVKAIVNEFDLDREAVFKVFKRATKESIDEFEEGIAEALADFKSMAKRESKTDSERFN